jgi:23S rRNA (cytosine1962-C5)-methyltransferase
VPLPTVRLPKSLERALQAGHPWVYRDHLPDSHGLTHGGWVQVTSGEQRAFALYDAESPIALRVFSSKGPLGSAEVAARLERAALLRAELPESGVTGFRCLNGEGDGFPGIVLDYYAGTCALVSYATSVEVLIPDLLAALPRALRVLGNTGSPTVVGMLHSRTRAGQAADSKESGKASPLLGELSDAPLVVEEYGVRLNVNLRSGQKTGLFLDHRENRRFIGAHARGRSVLNLFAYTGGFSLHAARGGATRVVSVDSAGPALEAARSNFALNGFDPALHEIAVADAFEYLEAAIARKERYDIVIVDPPSFARRKEQLEAALAAYRRVNVLAMKLVEPGGMLASASCTSQVSPPMFHKMLGEAAARARRTFQLVHEAGQPLDHPVMAGHPEGRYLKFVVGRVLEPS